MIKITKREGILLQAFLGVILVLGLYKLCIEDLIMELDAVKVQRKDKEEKFEEIKYDTNSSESSGGEVYHEDKSDYDADMIYMLDYIFNGVIGVNINIGVLNNGGYDTFNIGRNIDIEGELTLHDFFEVLRMSEEMDEKIKIEAFKLVFVGKDRVKCNVKMRIF